MSEKVTKIMVVKTDKDVSYLIVLQQADMITIIIKV